MILHIDWLFGRNKKWVFQEQWVEEGREETNHLMKEQMIHIGQELLNIHYNNMKNDWEKSR